MIIRPRQVRGPPHARRVHHERPRVQVRVGPSGSASLDADERGLLVPAAAMHADSNRVGIVEVSAARGRGRLHLLRVGPDQQERQEAIARGSGTGRHLLQHPPFHPQQGRPVEAVGKPVHRRGHVRVYPRVAEVEEAERGAVGVQVKGGRPHERLHGDEAEVRVEGRLQGIDQDDVVVGAVRPVGGALDVAPVRTVVFHRVPHLLGGALDNPRRQVGRVVHHRQGSEDEPAVTDLRPVGGASNPPPVPCKRRF